MLEGWESAPADSPGAAIVVSVHFRPYTPADFATLYAIEELCFEPPERFSRGYMRHRLDSSDSATWIAEENGKMAGFAIVVWSSQCEGQGSETNERAAYLETIELAPQWRRRGAARELLRLCEQSAIAAGARCIWLHVEAGNLAAQSLYESAGFTRRGREENYYPRGRAALVYGKTMP